MTKRVEFSDHQRPRRRITEALRRFRFRCPLCKGPLSVVAFRAQTRFECDDCGLRFSTDLAAVAWARLRKLNTTFAELVEMAPRFFATNPEARRQYKADVNEAAFVLWVALGRGASKPRMSYTAYSELSDGLRQMVDGLERDPDGLRDFIARYPGGVPELVGRLEGDYEERRDDLAWATMRRQLLKERSEDE